MTLVEELNEAIAAEYDYVPVDLVRRSVARIIEMEENVRDLETAVLGAAFSDRIDSSGLNASPLSWQEIALTAERRVTELEGEVEWLNGRFWLILHEPGCIPELKGCWPAGQTAVVLREFIRARPNAYIDVLTVDHGAPDVQHGPECLQVLDGRSMGVGRDHNARTREAHCWAHDAMARALLAEGRLSEAVGVMRAIHRDALANDFNELWDSYTALDAFLVSLEQPGGGGEIDDKNDQNAQLSSMKT